MQFTYRLIGTEAVDTPTRIDPQACDFPEASAWIKANEKVFLVPKDQLESHATLIRTTGAEVVIGVVDPDELPTDLSALVAKIA